MVAVARTKGIYLFVEILQRGSTVAAATRPIGRTGLLEISGGSSGVLAIPLYGQRANTRLFHSSRGKTFLELDRMWEGFVVCNGELIEVSRKRRPPGGLELRRGDYGSLVNDDLMLIFRVGPKPKVVKPAILRVYRPGLFSGIIRDRLEVPSTAYATLLATLLAGGFGFGLMHHPGPPRLAFETLSDPYNLPFISPDHLETAPEALQSNLVRSGFTASVVRYYRSLIAALTGHAKETDQMTFVQSRDSRRKAFESLNSDLTELRNAQKKSTSAALDKPLSAIMTIPALEGETIDGKISRLQDKIELHQKGLRRNLELKRKVSKIFPKDVDYNFDAYRDMKPGKKGLVNEETAAALAKIRPFSELTDEEAMYFQAQRAAQISRSLSQSLTRSDDSVANEHLAPETPVGLGAKVSFATYVFDAGKIFDDGKADGLQGSSIEPQKPRVIRIVEPMIGELDPRLVETTIKKYRHELQTCFEKALRRDKLTRGSMEWRWRIDSTGKLDELELVKSSIEDVEMARCVRQKMNAWRFPKPRRGSVEVTYPFEFNPSRG
jgi:hypothetical protein